MWTAHQTCIYTLVATEIKADLSLAKILALDMDGTLINTKPGDVSPTGWSLRFPKSPEILQQYRKEGWHIVIFSNQKNLSGSRQEQYMQRIASILKVLGPLDVFAAIGGAGDDEYRKPNTGMFKLYMSLRLQAYKEYAGYFVGDAEGSTSPVPEYRWSDSDKKFADATKLVFKRPEEVFK